jgi:hypothetical protein
LRSSRLRGEFRSFPGFTILAARDKFYRRRYVTVVRGVICGRRAANEKDLTGANRAHRDCHGNHCSLCFLLFDLLIHRKHFVEDARATFRCFGATMATGIRCHVAGLPITAFRRPR